MQSSFAQDIHLIGHRSTTHSLNANGVQIQTRAQYPPYHVFEQTTSRGMSKDCSLQALLRTAVISCAVLGVRCGGYGTHPGHSSTFCWPESETCSPVRRLKRSIVRMFPLFLGPPPR